MGDVFENRQAEELVHGRIHRLQTESESPQSDLGDVGEPVQRFTIATTAIATPQEFGWRGYEIELAVDSTPGVAVGVAFSRADADAGRVQRLYPGERFSSTRPFSRLWLVSVGGVGTLIMHLSRVSLVTRCAASPTRAPQSYAGGSANVAPGVVVDSGPLVKAVYICEVTFTHGNLLAASYWLEHRDAANAVTLARVGKSWATNGQTTVSMCRSLAAGERFRVSTDVGYALGWVDMLWSLAGHAHA